MNKKASLLLGAAFLICILSTLFFWNGANDSKRGRVEADPRSVSQEESTEQEENAFEKSDQEKVSVPEEKNLTPSSEQEFPGAAAVQEINPKAGKDQYGTDPVPEGKPAPVEPENTVVSDQKSTCTLSVRCDSILSNLDKLDPEKKELVPEDGVIFATSQVTFYEGESVFDVLQREMKSGKIHMEFVNTPVYNSAYIEGIHNLYEFDCGELSGWMYKVNGWFPNYGCSRYLLKEGDHVEWVYTCDLGRDVGGYQAEENSTGGVEDPAAGGGG